MRMGSLPFSLRSLSSLPPRGGLGMGAGWKVNPNSPPASGQFSRPEKSPSPVEHKSQRDLQAISGFCPAASLPRQ